MATQEEFDRVLDDLIHELGVAYLMSVEGVSELVTEDLNNEVLARIERAKDDDGDDDGEDQAIYDAVRKVSRAKLVELCEATGTAAFDDEPLDDLVDCVAESIKGGDLSLSDLEDY
jgi:hypothetical protein